jgi:hypothetical protein
MRSDAVLIRLIVSKKYLRSYQVMNVYFCWRSDHLSKYGLHLKDIAHINLLISNMDHFPSVNAVYGSFFGTSPPTRACVAVDLPPGVRIRLDCIAYKEPSTVNTDRYALHVQGISYWAPANIGPYSQAISVSFSRHYHSPYVLILGFIRPSL